MKARFSNLVEILAVCDDCAWTAEMGNAQGLASQHAERHGHMVGVTITRHHIYATERRYGMRPSEAKEAFGG